MSSQVLQDLQHLATHDVHGGPLSVKPLDLGPLVKSKGNQNEPLDVANGATPTPDMGTLLSLLNATTPEKAVESGVPPMPQNVAIVPSYTDKEAGENYKHLQCMATLSQLYTSIYCVNKMKADKRTEFWKISDHKEAVEATKAIADSAYEAMMQPLAGYYNITNQAASTFTQTMRKTDIHVEFLNELFKSLNLTPAALTEMDGILTTFVKSLQNVKFESTSKTETINHTVRINRVVKLNVSGDDKDPIWVFQPTTKLVYMKIDNSAYQTSVSVGKNNTVTTDSFDFKMDVVTVDADLNVDVLAMNKTKVNNVMKYLTGKSIDVFGAELVPKASLS